MTEITGNSSIITIQKTRPRRPSALESAWRLWRRRSNLAVNLSIVIVLVLAVSVMMAGVLAPHSPSAINLRFRLLPPLANPDFPLGTDATGRDILSRVLIGGQVSLLVSIAATFAGLVMGTLLGLVSGYSRGWIGAAIMYLVDVQLALPFLLLAVSVALVMGTSMAVLIGLAALSTWPVYARVVRASVLTLRGREFVIAALAVGASPRHIMRVHLLPNLVAPLLALVMLNVGRIILLESGLSFLGIGVQPPTPSWGIMINEGREYLSSAWWVSTVPGIVLGLLTMAVGTIGDWMRDLTDVSIS